MLLRGSDSTATRIAEGRAARGACSYRPEQKTAIFEHSCSCSCSCSYSESTVDEYEDEHGSAGESRHERTGEEK
jgi:hypothetical protein